MARTSKGPVYFASKNGWFTHFDGQPFRLTTGPKKQTEQAAREKYEQEKAARQVQTEGDRGPVRVVLEAWLKWSISREDPPPIAPNSYAINRRFVESFDRMFGHVTTREVKPTHFDEWLAAMKQPRQVGARTVAWGKGTCRLAINAMKAAFAWASTAGGIIKTNPFQLPGAHRLRLKRVRYKGKRVPITAGEHRRGPAPPSCTWRRP